MSNKKNVKIVREKALCHGCGVCSTVCPTKAISMGFSPGGYLVSSVDDSKCIACGKCLTTCSGVTSSVNISTEQIRGNCIEAYLGFASDELIRTNGQSGGIVTALLLHLIDSGKIEGAFVNSFSTEKNQNELVYAQNRDEILNSSGSYYSQSDVCKSAGVQNAAIVLLGCQAESISKSLNAYPKTIFPEYKIGLFCAGNHSRDYYAAIEAEAKIKPDENVIRFRFRDKMSGGWPGNITIDTTSRKLSISKEWRMEQKDLYKCFRCDLCFDRLNSYSDVAVGDPWGIKIEDDYKGYSVIIVRSEKGRELIREAADRGYISIQRIDENTVINGQGVNEQLVMRNSYISKICEANKWDAPFFYFEKDVLSKRFEHEIEAELGFHRNVYNAKSIDEVKRLRRKWSAYKKKINVIRRLKHLIKNLCKKF